MKVQQSAITKLNPTWFPMCLVLGIVIGVLTLEVVGMLIAPLFAVVLVAIGRDRGKRIATLLTFCAGYEVAPLWLLSRVILPEPATSWIVTPTPFLLVIAAFGGVMAAGAAIPGVRHR